MPLPPTHAKQAAEYTTPRTQHSSQENLDSKGNREFTFSVQGQPPCPCIPFLSALFWIRTN